jgi:5-oxoprolinase (ATP-hydrolysing)
LLDRGRPRHAALRELLQAAPYPSRAVAENMADIEAQVAANQQGSRELLQLMADKGWSLVQAYMRHIQDAAEKKMRQVLTRWPDGRYAFIDHLDNGAPISVTIVIDGDEATIDFAGTGPVQPGNLNANRAIVTAAVMYVFRCLIEEDIPLNQGVLAPLHIRIPPSLLNPPTCADPRDCAAVAGGNVETSQRVVDVLLGALGAAAASQGTMNNLLFGDATFGYYETICGGSGATATEPGASAVHTHMTNTRMTDPEVLELRYPVRVRRFAVRRGSGGRGRQAGGDGAVRELEFLRPLHASLVTQRRGVFAPYGLAGGEPGAVGRNTLRRADGRTEALQAAAQFDVGPGDVLIIETPGGGGYGAPQ